MRSADREAEPGRKIAERLIGNSECSILGRV